MTDDRPQTVPAPNPARPIHRRRRLTLVLAAIVGSAAIAAYVWHDTRTPRRFAAVVDGRLYRSGGVSPRQLEYLANRYGIRTVISLLNPEAPESVAEREAAQRLGLTWHNIPLPGNGASTPADRRRIRQLLNPPLTEPTLVHCAAGTNRTGLAIGLYRIHHDGWTDDQVIAEMLRFDFENGPNHQQLREALAAEAENSVRGANSTVPLRPSP